MRFISQLYPLKTRVSKNVQNYKKSSIHQKPETLKNYNFTPCFHYKKNSVFYILSVISVWGSGGSAFLVPGCCFIPAFAVSLR